MTVAFHATDHCYLPALCVSLQESGAEDKVSCETDFVYENMNLIHSRILSDVNLFCLSNIVGVLSHVLLACAHLTFIHFCLRMGHVYLALFIATYVKATSSLRRLRLFCTQSKTIRCKDQIDCLALAIGISRNMRRWHFQEEHLSKTAAFFRCLSEDVADNFNLVQIVSGVLDQNWLWTIASSGTKRAETAAW
ncbi:hypothetical protein HPB51_026909 [Rhipicephalus microplus]|uniref:Uncharacterized protein n=1 Tax=Rhipicephalus microplus TaxID=6941 RepID=A0A9J6D1E8_RHIMP|nr:hypothetical protein HPB51_026909 [Rhipicephalus microplus]